MTAMPPSRNDESPVARITPGDNSANDIGCCTCCTLDKPCKCDEEMDVDENASGRSTPPIGNCWSCLLGKIGFQDPFYKLSATPIPAVQAEAEEEEEEKEVPEPPPSYNELMSQEAVPALITPQLHESEDESETNFTFSHNDVTQLSCSPDIQIPSPTYRQPSPTILVTQFEQPEQVEEEEPEQVEEEVPEPSVLEEPLLIARQDTCESYLSDLPVEEPALEDAGPDPSCSQELSELQDYIKQQLEKLDIGEDLCSDDAVDDCQTPKPADEGYQLPESPRPTPPITNIIQATEDRDEEYIEVPVEVEEPIEEAAPVEPDILMFDHSPVPGPAKPEVSPVPSPDILMFDQSPPLGGRKSIEEEEVAPAPSPDLLIFDHSPVIALSEGGYENIPVELEESLPPVELEEIECLPPVEAEEVEEDHAILQLDDLETVHLTTHESEPDAPVTDDGGVVTHIRRVSEDVVEIITSTIDHVIHRGHDESPEAIEEEDVELCSPEAPLVDIPGEEVVIVELPSPPVEEEVFTLVHHPESPPAEIEEIEGPVSPSGSAEFQVIELPVPEVEEEPVIEEDKEEKSNFREFCANPLDKFGKLYDIYQGEVTEEAEEEVLEEKLATPESDVRPMPDAYDLVKGMEQEEEEDVLSTVVEESPQVGSPVPEPQVPEPIPEPEVVIEEEPIAEPEPIPESEPLIEKIIHLFDKSPSPVPEVEVVVEEPIPEPTPEPVREPSPEPVPEPSPELFEEIKEEIEEIIEHIEEFVEEEIIEPIEELMTPKPVPEPIPEPEVEELPPPVEEVVVMAAGTPMSVESWKTPPSSLDLSMDEDGLSTLKRGSKRSSRSSIPRSLSSRGSFKDSLKVGAEAAPVMIPDSVPMEEEVVEEVVEEVEVNVVDVAEAEDEEGEASKKKKKKSRHIPIFMRNIRKDLKEGMEKKEKKEKKKKGKDKFYGLEEAEKPE